MIRISVGILAWNEEKSISKTITSIFEQTLFARENSGIVSLELVCISNGCTDQTAAVAAAAMETLRNRSPLHQLNCFVRDLPVPGKGNAWNEFIHNIADQASDYVLMMDADIQLIHPETLENLVRTLNETPQAHVSTPNRVKHIALKKRKTLRDRISLGASEIGQSRPAMLAGCLYCARGDMLRKIWLPAGLVGEDAFLCAMLVTDLFTHETDNSRVVRAPNATVMFESYTSLSDVYYNLRRRAITRGINAMMYTYLWENVGTIAPNAGTLIKAKNDNDPDWFRKLVHNNVKTGGWWIMPHGASRIRLTALKNLPWKRRLTLFPVACLGFFAEAIVHVSANHAIKQGKIKGAWRDKDSACSQTGKA